MSEEKQARPHPSPLPQEREQGEQLLEALVTYCLTAGPPWCYREWPASLLRGYLAFHCEHGTMAWVDRNGKEQMANGKPEICGVGVAWQCWENEVRQAKPGGSHVFNWRPTNAKADSVYFADFISSAPGVVSALIAEFERRFPKWRGLKWWTHRKGELVQLNGTKYQQQFDPK